MRKRGESRSSFGLCSWRRSNSSVRSLLTQLQSAVSGRYSFADRRDLCINGDPAGVLLKIDQYVVIHVATTYRDEHGVYVTKDSAEVIELGWILVDANTLDEVSDGPAFTLLSRSTWALSL